jgi:hypothetical protein
MLLGSIGVLLCVAILVLGWWVASGTARRIDVIAARLDERLAQSVVKLGRLEQRVTAASVELHDIRRSAEAVVARNPQSAPLRIEFELLENRLTPILVRLRATAESLETLSEILLTAADIAEQLNRDGETAIRLRTAADSIHRAGAVLMLPQDKIDAVATAGAVQMGQAVLKLALKSIEGSSLLADGLSTARREAAASRARAAEFREFLIFRIYASALVITLLALWGGLGQVCLIGHGRRRQSNSILSTS